MSRLEMNITLQYSTGNQQIDMILQGLTNIFKTVFSNRIRVCYLRGSYANGTAVSTSDIDVVIVFKGRFVSFEEEEKARQICRQLSSISPVRLDAIPRNEEQLLTLDNTGVFKSQVAIQVSIKSASKLLYGEDIREKIPMPSIDVYARKCMHDVYYFYTLVRCPFQSLTYPMDYPDPDGEFYGYDQRQERTLDGITFNSTRSLVQNIMWSAVAIVALKARKYIRTKKDCVQLYKEYINDKWTGLIEEINDKCINQWEYLLPQKTSDRVRLRTLCKQALEFENHFLIIYKDYLLMELNNTDEEIKCFATKRLGQLQTDSS